MDNPITIDYDGDNIVISLPSGHSEKLTPESAELLLAALWIETKGEWLDWTETAKETR